MCKITVRYIVTIYPRYIVIMILLENHIQGKTFRNARKFEMTNVIVVKFVLQVLRLIICIIVIFLFEKIFSRKQFTRMINIIHTILINIQRKIKFTYKGNSRARSTNLEEIRVDVTFPCYYSNY